MKKFIVILFIAGLFAGGCVPQKPQMYSWGNYSHTLYNYTKNPNEKTYAKHKTCLHKIIEESATNKLRVPPGVYAELGYDLLNEGKTDEGLQYLLLEKKTYPESSVFIDKLMAKAEEK